MSQKLDLDQEKDDSQNKESIGPNRISSIEEEPNELEEERSSHVHLDM